MSDKSRGNFSSRWGFVLSCIGSAVGMGNIWMFPTRVSTFGGGTFLIIYLFFVALIASTGVVGEMSFGRAMRSGPDRAFEKACKNNAVIGKIAGIIPTFSSFAMASGYTVVMGWILKYTIGSFTGDIFTPDSTNEFIAEFKKISSPLSNNALQLVAVIITFVILFYGISKGIEKVNKVMMPLFFILFAGMGIYLLFLPGSADGYKYIFAVDFKSFKNPEIWVYALGQAFFSLSVAGNGTLIYGSYLSDKEDIPKSAGNVAFFDTLAAVLAGCVIIPAMATSGSRLDSGGPGLMFVYLPELFKNMPGGQVICCVFFTAVLFAGLTSLINLYETPVATLCQRLQLKRKTVCILVASAGFITSILIQGVVSQWMDILSIYLCPLGAGLAGIMFFWVSEKNFVKSQVNKGRKKPLGKWFFPVGKYIFCPLCFIVLIVGALVGGIG